MMAREFISPDILFRDSFCLAKNIHDSNYRPEIVLVLWRGGAPTGMVVHEFLNYHGVNLRHFIVKAESYAGIEEKGELYIHGISEVISAISQNERVLVVDDIYDTGNTLNKIREILMGSTCNVRTAALYMKKGHEKGPDYYVREVSGWVVFPHELMGLSKDEIMRKGKYIDGLLV